jgi:uncharacterized protein (TIGR00288 family)
VATESPIATGTNRNIALLIDADNISHTNIALIIAELSKHGTTNIRRAYGDWSSGTMRGWREKLHEFAVRPIQQFSYSSGKNATDIALVIDAMELLYTQKLDAFCIASSDGDFTPLVMQLKANGHAVYGFGQRKTPEAFVNACTGFLYLESAGTKLVDAPDVNAVDPTPAPIVQNPPSVSPKAKPLSSDTKLMTILRGGVEASIRDDGWAAMSAAGAAVKRQAPIDPRNYGVKNFTALFEKTKLFEIHKAENGQAFVADKRNKDRQQVPRT